MSYEQVFQNGAILEDVKLVSAFDPPSLMGAVGSSSPAPGKYWEDPTWSFRQRVNGDTFKSLLWPSWESNPWPANLRVVSLTRRCLTFSPDNLPPHRGRFLMCATLYVDPPSADSCVEVESRNLLTTYCLFKIRAVLWHSAHQTRPTSLSGKKKNKKQKTPVDKTVQLADDSVGFALKGLKRAACADTQHAETMLRA